MKCSFYVPLLVCDGLEAIHVEGVAEVDYSDLDNWEISAIHVEACGKGLGDEIAVQDSDPLYALLLAAIERHEAEGIREKILEELADDGRAPVSPYREHSTLHRVGQGV